MAPLPPRDQRHLWLRYQVVGYIEEIVHDFDQRLEMIFGRQVNRVHILDFKGLTPDMRQDLAERMRMVYIQDDGIRDEMGLDVASLHTDEEMAEDVFGAYWLGSERVILDKGVLVITRLRFLLAGTFREAPEKVTATDLFYLCSMYRGVANVLYILAQYLFRHAERRKNGARLSGGHFIGRLAHHFGLVSDDELRGLSIVARELPLIDIGELVKLNICMEIGDDWAWVASGPERQQVAAAGAPKAAEDALVVDEGAQADPVPVQAPQLPPPPLAAGRTMPPRLGRLK
ncbi:hypothetical protein Tco_0953520 [Tanacetum coccineum]|uniref:Uncharacterized protein n=1 Tax=Tanacetum coccineum TaxID=301880 RepID=A0ABQ5E049_9ASTR